MMVRIPEKLKRPKQVNNNRYSAVESLDVSLRLIIRRIMSINVAIATGKNTGIDDSPAWPFGGSFSFVLLSSFSSICNNFPFTKLCCTGFKTERLFSHSIVLATKLMLAIVIRCFRMNGSQRYSLIAKIR